MAVCLHHKSNIHVQCHVPHDNYMPLLHLLAVLSRLIVQSKQKVPEGDMKDLNPKAPAVNIPSNMDSLFALFGVIPPQKPTSAHSLP